MIDVVGVVLFIVGIQAGVAGKLIIGEAEILSDSTLSGVIVLGMAVLFAEQLANSVVRTNRQIIRLCIFKSLISSKPPLGLVLYYRLSYKKYIVRGLPIDRLAQSVSLAIKGVRIGIGSLSSRLQPIRVVMFANTNTHMSLLRRL